MTTGYVEPTAAEQRRNNKE